MENSYEESIKANIAVHSALADQYNSTEPHFRQESVDRVTKIVKNLMDQKSGFNALDLGCGTGFMINILKTDAKSITGVDVTQAMMDEVDKSGEAEIKLINSDTATVELQENHFDIATAYTFLDHLYELGPTLSNCYKSLKPGGVFYADLSPNGAFWTAIKKLDRNVQHDPILEREINAVWSKDEEIEAKFGIEREVFQRAEHQKHLLGGFTEEYLEKHLKAAGFKEIKFIYHWYVGQANLVNNESFGDKKDRLIYAAKTHEILEKSLPLTKHLFKYIGFVAKK